MASPSLPARATPPTARSSMMCSRQEMYEPSAACARVGVSAMVSLPSPDCADARSPRRYADGQGHRTREDRDTPCPPPIDPCMHDLCSSRRSGDLESLNGLPPQRPPDAGPTVPECCARPPLRTSAAPTARPPQA